MAASLTSNIASLILKVDDPNRDDLTSVNVWASTTSGFTPSSSNLVFSGKSFTILIPNLTPLITYYVKYAYISEIDPLDYSVSSELSAVPNKINGDLVVDGSITANKLSVNALSGKFISSGAFASNGTRLTADIASIDQLSNITIYVEDTSEFPDKGIALLFKRDVQNYVTIIYSGKTSTSLIGCRGSSSSNLKVKDIVISFPNLGAYSTGLASTSPSTRIINLQQTNSLDLFNTTGGSAIIINPVTLGGSGSNVDYFTYTGYDQFNNTLSGCSGLTTQTFSNDVIVLNTLNTSSAALSAGDYTTITATSVIDQSVFKSPGLAYIMSESSQDPYITVISYSSISGTNFVGVNVAGSDYPFTALSTATYRIIPFMDLYVQSKTSGQITGKSVYGLPFFTSQIGGIGDNNTLNAYSGYALATRSKKGTAILGQTESPTSFSGEFVGGLGLSADNVTIGGLTLSNRFSTFSNSIDSQFTANGYSSGTTQYGFNVNTSTVSATDAFYAYNATGTPNTSVDSLVSAYRSDYDIRSGPLVNLVKSHRTSNITHLIVDSWPSRSTNGMLPGLYITSAGTSIGLNANYVILALYSNVLSTLTSSITTSISSTLITFSAATTLNAGTRIYDSTNTFVGELSTSISSSTTGTLLANATKDLTAASAKYTYCAISFYSVGPDITLAPDVGNIKAYSNTLNFYNPSSGSAHSFFDSTVAINADLNITGSFRVAGNMYTSGVLTNQDGGIIGVYPSSVDGYDNAYTYIAGGAALSSTRGAYIVAYGNEATTYPGRIRLVPGSTASTSGSITLEGVTKINGTVFNSNSYSASTTLGYSNDIVFISAAAAWNLTLPSPLAGKKLDIIRTDSTAFTISVVGHINGVDATTNTTWFPASTAGRRLTLVSNGTTWYVLQSGTYS